MISQAMPETIPAQPTTSMTAKKMASPTLPNSREPVLPVASFLFVIAKVASQKACFS